MPPRKQKDNFAQFMRLYVEQSATNTLTFSEVALGLAAFQYLGILIHRIDYYPDSATMALMTADEDFLTFAITGDDTMTTLSTTDPAVYDITRIERHDFAAAANNNGPQLFNKPVIKDYTSLPGGGLLVPGKSMFLGLESAGLASEGAISARLWYTVKELKAEDYIELAQSLNVLSSN